MSTEAFAWVLTHVRIPDEVDVRQRPHLKIVLMCLANEADSQGKGAFPTIATLCAYTELSRSTIIRTLNRLAELGLIEPGNPAIAQAFADRQDRLPQIYDLVLNGVSYGAERGVIGASTGCHTEPNGVSYGGNGVSYGGNGVSYGGLDVTPNDALSRACDDFRTKDSIGDKFKEGVKEHHSLKNYDLGEGGAGGEPAKPPPQPPAKKRSPRKKYPEDFLMVWEAYGRRGNQPQSWIQWQAAIQREDQDVIMAAMVKYIEATAKDVHFRRHLERWLRDDGWESAPPTEPKPKPTTGRDEVPPGWGSRERQMEHIKQSFIHHNDAWLRHEFGYKQERITEIRQKNNIPEPTEEN